MTSAGGALGDPTAMVMPLSSLAHRCLCGVSLEAWATPKSERTPPTAGVSQRQRWAPEVSSRHPTGDCKGEMLAPPAAVPLPLKPWRPRRPSAREHRRRSVRGPVSSKRLSLQGAAAEPLEGWNLFASISIFDVAPALRGTRGLLHPSGLRNFSAVLPGSEARLAQTPHRCRPLERPPL